MGSIEEGPGRGRSRWDAEAALLSSGPSVEPSRLLEMCPCSRPAWADS